MTLSLHQQWEPSKEALREHLSPEDAESWLNALRLSELGPDRAVLDGVPNAFFHKRILRHFGPLLRDSLRRAFPTLGLHAEFHLVLRLREDAAALAADGAAPAERPAVLSPGFASFHAGEENRVALELARQVALASGGQYNPLFLTGPSGCGKSHLLTAIADTLAAGTPDGRVVHETAETFTSAVLEAMREKRMPALRERYRGAEALLLDDLDFIEVSAKAQEELLYTYEALLAAGKLLVFGATRAPSALGGLSEALRSRLESALVAELRPPGAEARRAILRAAAARAGITLAAADIDWLAQRIGANPRRLEGAVLRIAAYAGSGGQPVDSSYLRELAAPWTEAEDAREAPIPPRAVIESVCAEFNLNLKQFRSRDRSPQRDRARQLAMLLLRDQVGLSFGEIGRLVGNRANSTVLEGIAALRARMSTDRSLAAQRERVLHRLRRGVSEASKRISDRMRTQNDFSWFNTHDRAGMRFGAIPGRATRSG